MRDMGFTPSYADPDVWLRDAGDVYEYVVVYVDDLIAVMKNPKIFFDNRTKTSLRQSMGVNDGNDTFCSTLTDLSLGRLGQPAGATINDSKGSKDCSCQM